MVAAQMIIILNFVAVMVAVSPTYTILALIIILKERSNYDRD